MTGFAKTVFEEFIAKGGFPESSLKIKVFISIMCVFVIMKIFIMENVLKYGKEEKSCLFSHLKNNQLTFCHFFF